MPKYKITFKCPHCDERHSLGTTPELRDSEQALSLSVVKLLVQGVIDNDDDLKACDLQAEEIPAAPEVVIKE